MRREGRGGYSRHPAQHPAAEIPGREEGEGGRKEEGGKEDSWS